MGKCKRKLEREEREKRHVKPRPLSSNPGSHSGRRQEVPESTPARSPASHAWKFVVGKAGFEPATSASRTLFGVVFNVSQHLPLSALFLLRLRFRRLQGCRHLSMFLNVACPNCVQGLGLSALVCCRQVAQAVGLGFRRRGEPGASRPSHWRSCPRTRHNPRVGWPTRGTRRQRGSVHKSPSRAPQTGRARGRRFARSGRVRRMRRGRASRGAGDSIGKEDEKTRHPSATLSRGATGRLARAERRLRRPRGGTPALFSSRRSVGGATRVRRALRLRRSPRC